MCDGNLDSLSAMEGPRFAWWITSHRQIYVGREVAYSINKHGRWKISDLVKEIIDNLQDDDDGEMTPASKLASEGIELKQKSKCRMILVERKATAFGTKYYKGSIRLNSENIPYQADCYGYHDSSLGGKHVYPRQKAVIFRI